VTRITLDLDDPEFRRLEAEAERRRVDPGALAREFLQERLAIYRLTDEQLRQGREALAWFREFGRNLLQADIAAILEESRAELEKRSAP
jgi:hypothetical protein